MAMIKCKCPLSTRQAFAKRVFDIFVAVLALLLLWWVVLIAVIMARIDTGSSGFFYQKRVGRCGNVFRLIKIRTMKPSTGINTFVTTDNDPRITKLGRFFRKTKVDELPQLWNVLVGNMSLVGPRPDMPGFADQLHGDERLLLSVRPGITGPATLKYRDEEGVLSTKHDPEKYNREVIYPDKVRINLHYVKNWSFIEDLRCIWKTLIF